jgi:hypothetical protein
MGHCSAHYVTPSLTYDISFFAPRRACHSFQRTDDKEHVIRQRLAIFHREHELIRSFYHIRGVCVQVSAAAPVSEVWDDVRRHLLNLENRYDMPFVARGLDCGNMSATLVAVAQQLEHARWYTMPSWDAGDATMVLKAQTIDLFCTLLPLHGYRIAVWLAHVGRSSFTLRSRMYLISPPTQVAATSEPDLTWLDALSQTERDTLPQDALTSLYLYRSGRLVAEAMSTVVVLGPDRRPAAVPSALKATGLNVRPICVQGHLHMS